MMVGYPPFFADDPSSTCQKIIKWKKYFSIPKDANLSTAATDLIKRLICDANTRLGNNGAKEIKAHPFFKSTDWEALRISIPPFIPDLTSEVDTSNFDKFEEDKNDPFYPLIDTKLTSRIVLSTCSL
jgi:serine/threonine kinase 38